MVEIDSITVPTRREQDIMRHFACLAGMRLPIGVDLSVQLRRIFNLFPAVYKTEHSFYNSVDAQIVKMRLVDNAFSPEFEQQILRDMAKISCLLNPTAKPKTLARAIWKAYPHGYKNFNSFYHAFYKYFRKA